MFSDALLQNGWETESIQLSKYIYMNSLLPNNLPVRMNNAIAS